MSNANGGSSGAAAETTPQQAENPVFPAQNVALDTSQLKSTYCNVCNASATREEVVLNFGVNKDWDLGGPKLAVEVHHRVILNPHAARRLHEVLGQLLKDIETRYGDRL